MTAWASTETEPYAAAAAKAMGDELRKRGVKSGSIAITEGSFNTVENKVAEVFADTIKKDYPEFTPLQAQEEGFDPPPGDRQGCGASSRRTRTSWVRCRRRALARPPGRAPRRRTV